MDRDTLLNGFKLDSTAEQPTQGGHPAIREATGDDEVEIAEVGGHVQRETVTGDPTSDPDADGCELFTSPPDACQAGHAFSADLVIGRHSNQHFFEVSHVPMHVASSGIQIEDRITD